MNDQTVREIPILFSGQMVNAIRAGRKTVTRRVVDLRHVLTPDQKKIGFEQCNDPAYFRRSLLVKGVPRLTVPVRHPLDGHLPWDACDGNCEYARWSIGDRLWVRESCWLRPDRTRKMLREGADTWPPVIYAADQTESDREWTKEHGWIRRNSIHMPRVACRIVLEVEDVGLQRLHEISEEDAQAEGFDGLRHVPEVGGWLDPPSFQFRRLWQTLNADRGSPWDSNPYVWRLQFKVVEGLA
ncbi:MAG: hypothetical protein KGL39_56715 [Patescibacteria group bacterium]|nr:hypothetical protein [Patescibacteria group bacterium]